MSSPDLSLNVKRMVTRRMPKPVSLRELIRRLRTVGFEGPEWGGKHPFMSRGNVRVKIPNEHREDIRPPLLKEILRQAEISNAEWEQSA